MAFQFTPLREGRRLQSAIERDVSEISIHAPPRGATCRTSASAARRTFQFTPLREGRPSRRDESESQTNFNSRPSARGDAKRPCCARADEPYFNSRPSARGDHDQALFPAEQDISIHAPPRGATWKRRASGWISTFQFTPLREGRLHEPEEPQDANSISIHAPPRGATWQRRQRQTRR